MPETRLEQSWLKTVDPQMWLDAQAVDRRFADLKGALMGDGPVALTLGLLKRISLEHHIPMAVVGGIATNYYGLQRTTEDVDIVIDKGHLADFCQAALAAGFVQVGPTRFHLEGGYPVDLLLSGTFPTPDSLFPTPTPAELGVASGLDYADLAAWVSLKLLAGRPEDIGDIYRLLARRQPADCEEIRGRLDPRARSRFDQVIQDLKRRFS